VFLLPILIGALAATDPAPANAAPAAPVETPTPAPGIPPTPPGVVPPVAPGAAPAPAPDAPVSEEEQTVTPTPAPTPPGGSGQAFPTPYTDLDAKAYSDAVLAAANEEEALQGPLDGGWSVTSEAGKALYSIRMVDHGKGMSLAEGAWRDLGVQPGPAAVGFVESVGWDGRKLTLRFYESGPDDLVVLTLSPSAADAWSGELWRHGAIVKVVFRRDRT
jgi:hypothetical protein